MAKKLPKIAPAVLVSRSHVARRRLFGCARPRVSAKAGHKRLLQKIAGRQRARTTSFFVQLWTWRQWGQVNLGVFTFAAAQSCSSIVWPVAVSFAVEGHRTRSRLMTGPVFTLRGEVVAKNFIFYASR